jgi:O-antigen biosynthesis protein WbqP
MYSVLKRVLDIFFALVFIIILLPAFIIIPIIIFLQDRHSPIFKQARIGKLGEEFMFYKFRSMPIETPDLESKEKGKLKITPFGKIIRRTNFDELPQVFNILKGDMSWIGPRPPILSQKRLIQLRKENKALNLKPGLTGLAQINSYDDMPEEVKAKYDGEYAERISLYMDFIIMMRTFVYFTKKPPTY